MNPAEMPEVREAVAAATNWYARRCPGVLRDDVAQEAWVGAVEAMRTWSPERGRAFPYARKAAFLKARDYCLRSTSPFSAVNNGKTRTIQIREIGGNRFRMEHGRPVAPGDCLLGSEDEDHRFLRGFVTDLSASGTFQVSFARFGAPLDFEGLSGVVHTVRAVEGSSKLGIHGGEARAIPTNRHSSRTAAAVGMDPWDVDREDEDPRREAWRAELSRVFGSVACDEEALDAVLAAGEPSKIPPKMRERVAAVMRRLRESPNILELRSLRP